MNDKVLIICEMANNHMGDMAHATSMIEKFADILSPYKDFFNFAWKFQFRHLDSFIHKDYVNRQDHKYVKRFQETALSPEEFEELKRCAETNNFKTMCTAFDEKSVDLIDEMNFDIIKVASCSFTDWPLLNKIVESNEPVSKELHEPRPIILSTAGASLNQIDRVVSFMKHRSKDFTIMHCVGEYPTKEHNLQINQIDLLKQRYPNMKIGYSTHEEPTEINSIGIALAKGATVAEKHVALATNKYKPNAYSVTPSQMLAWIESAHKALIMCGCTNTRHAVSEKEIADLKQFKRGAFAKNDIKTGDNISKDDIYYAWPSEEGQILANDISKYGQLTALSDVEQDTPLYVNHIDSINIRDSVWDIVQNVKSFLNKSNVVYPSHADLEISHHYGIEKFAQTGISMITVVNRDYCKKLIIVLPEQTHPEQYHLKKEETFIILSGELNLILKRENSIEEHYLNPGDVITIDPKVKHSFSSEKGCILEEVSSTHFVDDSYYTDSTIAQNNNRKTFVSYWI